MFDLAKKPEILAPAGSMEAFKAAVYYGADAVYLGGLSFGARAFADNFDEETLIQAIDYAHLYGVKVYLTVNTLFRNDEIKDLFSYIKPYYEAGLDAVIVQDLGVVEYIHRYFPDIAIHASTQMSITTPFSYELLKDYGVNRIVPARELSIDEIKAFKSWDYKKDCNKPELEVFVQGALCLCYSGQCLMSSFIGGRSGNRGRCAQSCRLPYSLYDSNGKKISMDGDYILSPKDLFGLDSVFELICAGVDSFKIEGRMKKPLYVAACTKAYRKCVDYIFDNIIQENFVLDNLSDNVRINNEYEQLVSECRQEMASVFNRGGFTKGYYYKKNGKDMMSMLSPGHMGTDIGIITGINKNQISIKPDKAVNKGDILVIREVTPEITLTCNIDSGINKEIYLNVPRAKEIKCGMHVFRMLDYSTNMALSKYKDNDRKIPVTGKITLKQDQPAIFQISVNDYTAKCKGAIVEKAASKPVTENIVIEKLRQTGETLFEFKDLLIEMDSNIFIPMKALKQLRRDCFTLLEETVKNSYKRITLSEHNENNITEHININKDNKALHIIMSSMEQLAVIEEYMTVIDDNIEISLDLQYFSKSDIIMLTEKHKKIGLVLPMVFRKRAYEELNDMSLEAFDRITVKNIDELAYLKHRNYTGKVIIDYSLYVMNDNAASFMLSQFKDIVITLPVELNKAQLKQLNSHIAESEWIIYNYQPLMVSAQCFRENSSGCDNTADNSFVMTDRTNHSFFVKTICKYCYNVVINGIPTFLADQDGINVCRKRIQLSIEDKKVTRQLMEYLQYSMKNDQPDMKLQNVPFKEYTRGHFNRGVT